MISYDFFNYVANSSVFLKIKIGASHTLLWKLKEIQIFPAEGSKLSACLHYLYHGMRAWYSKKKLQVIKTRIFQTTQSEEKVYKVNLTKLPTLTFNKLENHKNLKNSI